MRYQKPIFMRFATPSETLSKDGTGTVGSTASGDARLADRPETAFW
jgi:hypothetical protein